MQTRGNTLVQRLGVVIALVATSGIADAQSWSHMPIVPFNVGAALQLTDGTILVEDWDVAQWWVLVPDSTGNYAKGGFVPTGPVPLKWVPNYFASAVLPDGKVIVEGGEFNNLNSADSESSKGAIYDPATLSWTEVKPPTGWKNIGDAPSIVLPNKTYMIGNIFNTQFALFDESSLSWTVFPGTGKFDANSEEGWTLLPGDKLLAVDTYLGVPPDPTGKGSEIYDPSSLSWSSAGATVKQLWDSRKDCGGSGSNEVGPAVLRPNGTVFATGANTCPGEAGHTAIYHVSTKKWSKGPDFPGGNDMADAPAAVLPDGKVLVETNQGYGKTPVTFYEFNGTKFNPAPSPTGYSGNSEGGRMLVTPNGTVMLTHESTNDIWFYHSKGSYQSAWRPTITSFPSCIEADNTYTVKGRQLNGLGQGAAFGDDGQSATNFPLVRITNKLTGHVFFARTHDFSTMGVATGSTVVSAKFDVLSGIETGASTVQVIANGIPSKSRAVNVESPCL